MDLRIGSIAELYYGLEAGTRSYEPVRCPPFLLWTHDLLSSALFFFLGIGFFYFSVYKLENGHFSHTSSNAN